MTISQKTTPEDTTAGDLACPHCKAALPPPPATFCSSCGERLLEKQQQTSLEEQDIQSRYRIKTLVRRYPHTNLYFALDNHYARETGQTRMVAIRDIDVAGLEKEVREQAVVFAQQEYDCLRRWNIPHTLTCIDLRVFQGHIFLISALSGATNETPSGNNQQRLYTLQDFLQSGLGLPREARTLEWTHNLCLAVEQLHRHHILLGDLDPYTVILDKSSAQAEPRLMPFWLWPDLATLLSQPLLSSTPQVSYFKAPEALTGKVGIRSDIYSLGALLYLLLTGTPPDESTLRHRRRLRTPREMNSRISQHVDDCVMRALAVEPEERFPNITAFLTALEDVRANQPPRKAFPPPVRMPEVSLNDVETVRIVPLSQKDVERWRSARDEHAARKAHLESDEEADSIAHHSQSLPSVRALPETITRPPLIRHAQPNPATPDPGGLSTLPTTPLPRKGSATLARADQRSWKSGTPPPMPDESSESKPSWPRRITNILPTIKPENEPQVGRARGKNAKPARVPKPLRVEKELSLLKQIQHLILGQQQHTIVAAAIIETPMRVRPDQPYNLRLHIVGRDQPTPHPHASQGEPPAGLSALVHGEIALVEVRSVLQQGYTYIVQQATVTIPADGYAAEVTIPMQQQTVTSTGRRDRLHVFFLDEQRQPLYEKPFVVEVFVSPLVQFGREGHQVLTIPI